MVWTVYVVYDTMASWYPQTSYIMMRIVLLLLDPVDDFSHIHKKTTAMVLEMQPPHY